MGAYLGLVPLALALHAVLHDGTARGLYQPRGDRQAPVQVLVVLLLQAGLAEDVFLKVDEFMDDGDLSDGHLRKISPLWSKMF